MFLLGVFTMLLALVPFVGSAIVWGPVCFWLYAVQGVRPRRPLLARPLPGGRRGDRQRGQTGRAARPFESSPLAGLAERAGGIQALGPIGIFIGPMAVAFLQTLLNMVHTELNTMTRSEAPPARPSPL